MKIFKVPKPYLLITVKGYLTRQNDSFFYMLWNRVYDFEKAEAETTAMLRGNPDFRATETTMQVVNPVLSGWQRFVVFIGLAK